MEPSHEHIRKVILHTHRTWMLIIKYPHIHYNDVSEACHYIRSYFRLYVSLSSKFCFYTTYISCSFITLNRETRPKLPFPKHGCTFKHPGAEARICRGTRPIPWPIDALTRRVTNSSVATVLAMWNETALAFRHIQRYLPVRSCSWSLQAKQQQQLSMIEPVLRDVFTNIIIYNEKT